MPNEKQMNLELQDEDAVPMVNQSDQYVDPGDSRDGNHSQVDKLDSLDDAVDALLEIVGHGRYQQRLLILCGLGWLNDGMYAQVLSLILPSVQKQFDVSDSRIGWVSASMFGGAMVGSLFWGNYSSKHGRRPAFTYTFALTLVFAVLVALAPTFWLLCLMVVGLGFGYGGNIPVDSVIFLEFTPKKHRELAILINILWCVGSTIAALLAWILIPIHHPWTRFGDNYTITGWRIVMLCLACCNLIMFASRLWLISLQETPKFLMQQGRGEEAYEVLMHVAQFNGTRVWTLEEQDALLQQVKRAQPHVDLHETQSLVASLKSLFTCFLEMMLDVHQACKRNARLTTLTLMFLWLWTAGSFGWALFAQFVAIFIEKLNLSESPAAVYRDTLLYAAMGIPSTVVGYYLVKRRWGMKWTMVAAAFASSASLGVFALVADYVEQHPLEKDQSRWMAEWLIALSSSIFNGFMQILASVMYAITPESYPTRVRTSAVGLLSACGRM